MTYLIEINEAQRLYLVEVLEKAPKTGSSLLDDILPLLQGLPAVQQVEGRREVIHNFFI